MDILKYHPEISTITYKGFNIGILRLDKIHPEISGNKWFKLKHNINQALTENKKCILTFGGAFSNHIAATSKTCKLVNLKSIGIIRGLENTLSNPTLDLAKKNGMEFQFISREEYKNKTSTDYLADLSLKFPDTYIIPEGGDNDLGEFGCSEILTDETTSYDEIFCAYGTGTTFKGISKSLKTHQQLIAINVLKFVAEDLNSQSRINNNYHFGGYAKHTKELIEFKKWFENEYNIPIDYVYTSKLFFAVFDLINQGSITYKKNILIIHSGGLQGNKGYEERYNLFKFI